ncbi:MAG: hypothetical protein Q7U20_00255 [Caulobacter sp.]|nr:hypothetical protein [Caulobacter sp.]
MGLLLGAVLVIVAITAWLAWSGRGAPVPPVAMNLTLPELPAPTPMPDPQPLPAPVPAPR